MAALAKYLRLVYYKNVSRFLKGIFLFCFFIILILFSQNKAFAVSFTIETIPQISQSNYLDLIGNVDEKLIRFMTNDFKAPVVTENTETVIVHFKGLSKDQSNKKKYKVHLFSDLGKDNRDKEVSPTAGGTLDFPVCADGQNDLKFAKNNNGDGDKFDPENSDHIRDLNTFHCSKDDYFWGDNIYRVTLFDEDDNLVKSVPFFVARFYPTVVVEPSNPTTANPIKITITGTRRPRDDEDRNNYTVEYASQTNPDELISWNCTTVKADKNGVVTKPGEVFLSPESKPIPLDEGDYIIKINEQTHEGGWFRGGCSAGFPYYTIKLRVGIDKGCIGEPPDCKGDQEIDPSGSDLKGIIASEDQNTQFPVVPPPCTDSFTSKSANCPKVKTAIIDIDTTPSGFVKSIFGIVLGLSGGIALLLIIYSGYQLMASQGNPEKLEAARQQLISAIIGLVFIIFSLVILQIIGVDILKIPGLK